jgi:hypothetical protein
MDGTACVGGPGTVPYYFILLFRRINKSVYSIRLNIQFRPYQNILVEEWPAEGDTKPDANFLKLFHWAAYNVRKMRQVHFKTESSTLKLTD